MQKGWPAGSANTYSGSSGSVDPFDQRSSRRERASVRVARPAARRLRRSCRGEVAEAPAGRPSGRRQLGDPLDGQPRFARPVREHSQSAAVWAGLSRWRCFVAGPVHEAKEFAVELGDRSGIDCVKDHSASRETRPASIKDLTLSTPACSRYRRGYCRTQSCDTAGSPALPRVLEPRSIHRPRLVLIVGSLEQEHIPAGRSRERRVGPRPARCEGATREYLSAVVVKSPPCSPNRGHHPSAPSRA